MLPPRPLPPLPPIWLEPSRLELLADQLGVTPGRLRQVLHEQIAEREQAADHGRPAGKGMPISADPTEQAAGLAAAPDKPAAPMPATVLTIPSALTLRTR